MDDEVFFYVGLVAAGVGFGLTWVAMKVNGLEAGLWIAGILLVGAGALGEIVENAVEAAEIEQAAARAVQDCPLPIEACAPFASAGLFFVHIPEQAFPTVIIGAIVGAVVSYFQFREKPTPPTSP